MTPSAKRAKPFGLKDINHPTEEAMQAFDPYTITFVAFHLKPLANPDTSAPSPPTATFIIKMRQG